MVGTMWHRSPTLQPGVMDGLIVLHVVARASQIKGGAELWAELDQVLGEDVGRDWWKTLCQTVDTGGEGTVDVK